MVRENVDGIGICYEWTLCASKLGDDGNCRLFAGTQSGTNTYSLEILSVDSLREDSFLSVELDDSLRDTNLQNHTIALGSMGSNFSGTDT